MSTNCNCCEDLSDGCPSTQWIPLHRWRGSFTVPNHLREIHLASFKLRFTHLSTTQTTSLIPKNATYTQIQSALAALTNIGSGVVVTGGPLPNQIFIEFASPSTTNLNVESLSVLDENDLISEAFQITTKTEGTASNNEIQSFTARPSRWEQLDLDRYLNSTWMWRVVIQGTGNVPDLTKLCLQQHRLNVREWVARISDQPSLVHFKLELGNMRWEDAPLADHSDLTGGTYDLTLTTNFWSETITLDWDSTALEVETALRALPNAARAGTISVSGGPLAHDIHIGIEFDSPLETVTMSVVANLTGTSPPIRTATKTDGGGIDDEEQYVWPAWPANGGTFTLSIKARGTTQTTDAIPANAPMTVLQDKITNLINIQIGEINLFERLVETYVRDNLIIFVGGLAGTNIPLMTGTSSLTNSPTLSISQVEPSNLEDFRAEYDPLNVGTTWQGYIRTAYGNVVNRAINVINKTFTENVGNYESSITVAEQSCGYGTLTTNQCNSNGEFGVRGLEGIASTSSATQVNGDVVVTSAQPFEFEFQIMCLGCYYDSSFNLWGMNEKTVNRNIQLYDGTESYLYEPPGGKSCNSGGPCRNWSERYNNEPYLYRSKFGPDGYDAHLINDKFVAQGGLKTRQPTCKPDVVMLGDGYWLEQNYSRSHASYSCSVETGIVLGCAVKPKREYTRELPVAAIDRLKEIYGTTFSYWGGWINPDSMTAEKISCTFSNYDLTDTKVLFLGGVTIGHCPQTSGTAGIVLEDTSHSGGHSIQLESSDPFFSTGWRACLNKEFEEGALQPLKEWLGLGGKTLVLDGGFFPMKFLEEMGLSTTVEQNQLYQPITGESSLPGNIDNTLNGSAYTTPVWGPELPDPLSEDYHEVYFEPLHLNPVDHPFTFGISDSYVNGDSVVEPDLTMQMTGIAGEPIDEDGNGATGVSKGLVNITQKWRWGRSDGVKPVAGLREYTTSVLKLVPGSSSQVIGRVKGKVPVAPWYDNDTNEFITEDIDYPAIVAEWFSNQFRISVTHQDTTETTISLDYSSTAAEIQSALEDLSNVGVGVLVTGGPLPGSIDITFSSPGTTLQDIETLVVLDNDGLKVETVSDGSGSADEVQRILSNKVPSRVIISYISELVEPDAWGLNWRTAVIAGPVDGEVIKFISDNSITSLKVSLLGCVETPFEDYCKDGYNFGLGLSNIVHAQFLLNLLERSDDY